MVKVAGVKTWNWLKRDSFFAHFFQKSYLQNTFGWLLLLIPLFQSMFYHTFMIPLFSSFTSCFSFFHWHSWYWDYRPLLLRHPLFDLAYSFFKALFALPYFLFHLLLRYFRQCPTLTQPHPVLIWPTNLPWCKQIIKRTILPAQLSFSFKNKFLIF